MKGATDAAADAKVSSFLAPPRPKSGARPDTACPAATAGPHRAHRSSRVARRALPSVREDAAARSPLHLPSAPARAEAPAPSRALRSASPSAPPSLAAALGAIREHRAHGGSDRLLGGRGGRSISARHAPSPPPRAACQPSAVTPTKSRRGLRSARATLPPPTPPAAGSAEVVAPDVGFDPLEALRPHRVHQRPKPALAVDPRAGPPPRRLPRAAGASGGRPGACARGRWRPQTQQHRDVSRARGRRTDQHPLSTANSCRSAEMLRSSGH
jgi:hypothetical protein